MQIFFIDYKVFKRFCRFCRSSVKLRTFENATQLFLIITRKERFCWSRYLKI